MKFVSKKWKDRLYEFWIEKKEGILWIHFKGLTYTWSLKKSKNLSHYERENFQDFYSLSAGKQSEQSKIGEQQKLKEKILSPMPGRIQKIPFKQGEHVKKGELLFVLSSMKIEYSFQMEANGYIKKIKVKEGDTVKKEELLMELNYKTS